MTGYGEGNNEIDLGNIVINAHVQRLRDSNTDPSAFRATAQTLGEFLVYHMALTLPYKSSSVTTPMGVVSVADVPASYPYVVELERGGHMLLTGGWNILPWSPGGKIGISRSHGPIDTLKSTVHYVGLPKDLEQQDVFLLDIMLATGVSLIGAVDIIKERNAGKVNVGAVIATQYGIQKVHEAHPDVPVFYLAKDPILNEIGYIIPGLGDAGDRCFGTK
jgi:uracil phosphoribosyltransferase